MNRRAWTDDDKRRLAELYPIQPTKSVAEALGRSLVSVNGTAFKLGLRKTPEYFASDEYKSLLTGATCPQWIRHRYPKGHAPANKGLRRPGWHRGRMKETQFKKGERTGMAARNWVPIGTVRPDPDGYLRIKVRDAVYGKEPTGFGNVKVWPLYSRYLWEQHHGPIPPRHIVAFKDGDRKNCVIDNLALMSMVDNARRNSMWAQLPRDLAVTIQLNGVLKRKLRKLDGKE